MRAMDSKAEVLRTKNCSAQTQVHSLVGMATGQGYHALEEAVSTDAWLLGGCLALVDDAAWEWKDPNYA